MPEGESRSFVQLYMLRRNSHILWQTTHVMVWGRFDISSLLLWWLLQHAWQHAATHSSGVAGLPDHDAYSDCPRCCGAIDCAYCRFEIAWPVWYTYTSALPGWPYEFGLCLLDQKASKRRNLDGSVLHLSDIEINSLVLHPAFPILVLSILGRPLGQELRTRPFEHLWNTVPCVTGLLAHVNGITRL
jgi:hypothetical protein